MTRRNGLSIFGRTFECDCGRTHRVTPYDIIYDPQALAQLPAVCRRHCPNRSRRAAVLMDVRTREVAGRQAAAALAQAGWEALEVLVPDPAEGTSPTCDEQTKNLLAARVAGADLIVSAGAGVINDLGKWLAFEMDVPAAAVATAASMNGYSSANVAPTVEGVKTLLRARPPVAVLTAPAILKDAPYELTAAGLGDALAKSVSSADWYLNHLLFGDHYCAKSVGLVTQIEPLYLEHPSDLRQRKDEAVAALFDALLLTGAAMTMAETSAPASGGEHLISHSLDMMSSLDQRPHDLHGRQVGVGAVLTAELYRRVLAVESPWPLDPPAKVDHRFWGPLADGVAYHFSQKADRLRQAAETLSRGDTWDRLREAVQPLLRTPRQIRECLAAAGAAYLAEDIRCDRARLLAAFVHGHEIRSRFTVLDLAWLLEIMPQAAGEIIDMWA